MQLCVLFEVQLCCSRFTGRNGGCSTKLRSEYWGHSHIVSLWCALKLFGNSKWSKRFFSDLIKYSRIRLNIRRTILIPVLRGPPRVSEMSTCFITNDADWRARSRWTNYLSVNLLCATMMEMGCSGFNRIPQWRADRESIESFNK